MRRKSGIGRSCLRDSSVGTCGAIAETEKPDISCLHPSGTPQAHLSSKIQPPITSHLLHFFARPQESLLGQSVPTPAPSEHRIPAQSNALGNAPQNIPSPEGASHPDAGDSQANQSHQHEAPPTPHTPICWSSCSVDEKVTICYKARPNLKKFTEGLPLASWVLLR